MSVHVSDRHSVIAPDAVIFKENFRHRRGIRGAGCLSVKRIRMKTSKILLLATLFGMIALMLTSCFNNEDPGPLQEQTKEYSILDFERLEIGDAMDRSDEC